MQTDNNNMDNKLRQLDNQSLPDLSRQDEHWQQMQQTLQSGVTPGNKDGRSKRSWYWIAAACIIGLFFMAVYKWLLPHNEEKSSAANPDSQTISNNQLSKDTTSSVNISNNNDRFLSIPGKSSQSKQSISIKPKIIDGNNSSDTIIQVTPVTTQPTENKKESQTLAGFFKQMEKATQEFVIDPTKDTVVNGADGTALLIPANTLNSKRPVTILLKEYYSYEDIITNKLTTCSNGQQLVTGGMIHILAVADGKEVNVNPGKSFRWFVPDTSAVIKEMQLFIGDVRNSGTLLKEETFTLSDRSTTTVLKDTSISLQSVETVNWIPQNQLFATNFLVTKVKVLDLQNDPYRAKETKYGTIGKFHIAKDTKISRDQLAEDLKNKYGYYKVIIKKIPDSKSKRKRRSRIKVSGSAVNPMFEFSNAFNSLGDSAWISMKQAKFYKLEPTDTVTYTLTGISFSTTGTVLKKTFNNTNLNALANRFSVDIRTLGWINCDRFYRDNRPKVDYYVNLKDTALNYHTVLVFEDMKSMMQGLISGNKVIFMGVPKGISARVISVGIQDGKAVAAMEKITPDRSIINNLRFEETTPNAFKEQAATMDK